MKIAFFHELHFGGARRVVYEYGKELSKNHEITLFYVDKEKENDVEKYFRENHYFNFNYRRYEGGDFKLKFYKDFFEPIKLYLLHRKIAKEIDNGKFDFVFVHPSLFTHAPFILRFLKTPHVYICHEPLRISHDPIVGIPKSNFLKTSYEVLAREFKSIIDASNIKKAQVVLANCEYTRKNIKKAYGIDSETLYLGIDPVLFRPLGIKKDYDLIFVGDVVWMEGYDTFEEVLQLFKIKPKIKIIKPEKGKYISDEDLAKEYNKSKILVVLGRFDPFSMIPWEGMACGLAVVVVDEGGPVEAVKTGETGYLVKRDPKKIKNVIESLLIDPSLRKRIATNGRSDVVKNWTWEKSSERLLHIVKKKLSI